MDNQGLEKGIVIVATGHPSYGRMAYNLAVTIQAAEEKFPVAVLYNGAALNHLSERQKTVFSHIIPIDPDIAADAQCKLHAYEYTPFERTLLLDADMLWLPERMPSQLFATLKDVQFTGITEGDEENPNPDYYFWADVEEIRSVYPIQGKLYQWRTEVLYFTADAAPIFQRAIEVVNEWKLKSMKLFGGKPSDEMGILIAAGELNIAPHIYKWIPSYWYLLNKGQLPELGMLYMKYWLLSFGSNTVTGSMKKMHDRLMKAACYKLKIQHVFPIESKMMWNKDRKNNITNA